MFLVRANLFFPQMTEAVKVAFEVSARGFDHAVEVFEDHIRESISHWEGYEVTEIHHRVKKSA